MYNYPTVIDVLQQGFTKSLCKFWFENDTLIQVRYCHLHFKVFLTIYLHQFGWFSERGGNFLNLLQKEGGTQKGRGSLRKGGVPTLEESLNDYLSFITL